MKSTARKPYRFSDREKQIVFSLFDKYKYIIDYKYRRNSVHKQSEVRVCWDKIVEEFNQHPETEVRESKQIQKFWLNCRVRKRLPSSPPPSQIKCKLNPDVISLSSGMEIDDSYMKKFDIVNDISDIRGDENIIELKFLPTSEGKTPVQNCENSSNEKDPFEENQDNQNDVDQIGSPYTLLDDDDLDEDHENPIPSRACQNSSLDDGNRYDDKMAALRLLEMQHKVNEQKYRSSIQEVALLRAREELSQLRRIHQLQVEEMKIKLDNLRRSSYK